MKTIFLATVNDDLSLRPVNPVKWKSHLLSLKGFTVDVTMEKHRKKRSDDQNRYYWAVVLKTIGDFCGYSGSDELESLHIEFRRKFLPKRGILNLPVSTTDLTTVEFSEYIEQIRRWAAQELRVYVPEPGEVTE